MSALVRAARPLLTRWETLLVVLLALFMWLGASLSPYFIDPGNFSDLTSNLMEKAIMALPLALVIIAGEIDLSVESMLGLSSALLGFTFGLGVPLWAGIPLVLVVGGLGGLLNGLLVTWAKLPSLVVTLGTLALFRGLAYVVLGPNAVSSWPAAFNNFGFGDVPGTLVPWPFVVFAALAVVFAFVLHRTWIGRQVFATGKNKEAARFAGVRVARLKTTLFVLSGVLSALAGVILTARLASARADNGQGFVLDVVTAVLLGGVNIFDVAASGGQEAARALGGQFKQVGPSEASGAAQVPYIQNLTQQHVNAIVVSADDPDAIAPALKQAMQRGIKVVGYDSSPATDARNVFVNQADLKSIGEGQVKLICDEIPGCSGEIGIVSASSTATNQNAWINYMQQA